MSPKLLILAGTTEATALARAVADQGMDATVSFAGRVERPIHQPLPQRVGGFGGASGLAQYLQDAGITHVIDATHPFAAQMSRNAVQACAQVGVHLLAFTRPSWVQVEGDVWTMVPDIAGAVQALDRPAQTVLLAVGRMHLADFASQSQHRYVLRLVDPPKGPLPFPDAQVIVDRGPFSFDADFTMMRERQVELVVSKNAGGTGAYAKIAAARALGVPVIMIDRPELPKRAEVYDLEAVFHWIHHGPANRGV